MASISCQQSLCTLKSGQKSNKQKIQCLQVNGNKSFFPAKVDLLREDHNVALTCAAPVDNLHSFGQPNRQIIPTKKQLVDHYRQGILVDEGLVYRQTFVIRSYEVGADRTATIDTILGLLQETAVSHVWMTGLVSGFGRTHAMMRNNIIWVISKMQVQIEHFPIWGEVIEIDSWFGQSRKNELWRDWVVRSQATGLVLARANSKWVTMNQQTRRLSKVPDEVRAELSPFMAEKQAIQENLPEKIDKLDNNALYVRSKLKPKRSDLDMNQHVNNVKYVRWMLDTIPEEFLENYQLSDIVLEYRRECGSSDVVQSLCDPQKDEILNQDVCRFTHLLQIKGETKNQEAVRGKTTWKKKLNTLS